MPTYDYKCLNPACAAEYEYFHLNSADKNVCPKCASTDAEKLTAKVPPTAQFKGSGFHVNDYGKRGRR